MYSGAFFYGNGSAAAESCSLKFFPLLSLTAAGSGFYPFLNTLPPAQLVWLCPVVYQTLAVSVMGQPLAASHRSHPLEPPPPANKTLPRKPSTISRVLHVRLLSGLVKRQVWFSYSLFPLSTLTSDKDWSRAESIFCSLFLRMDC